MCHAVHNPCFVIRFLFQQVVDGNTFLDRSPIGIDVELNFLSLRDSSQLLRKMLCGCLRILIFPAIPVKLAILCHIIVDVQQHLVFSLYWLQAPVGSCFMHCFTPFYPVSGFSPSPFKISWTVL